MTAPTQSTINMHDWEGILLEVGSISLTEGKNSTEGENGPYSLTQGISDFWVAIVNHTVIGPCAI